MIKIAAFVVWLSYLITMTPVDPLETGAKVQTKTHSARLNDDTSLQNQDLSSNFSTLHQSLQEKIIQHALDQADGKNISLLASTNGLFFNVSSRHFRNITIDFKRLNRKERFFKLICHHLKEKKVATFNYVRKDFVQYFKYFDCFENLEELNINLASGVNITFFKKLPKLKSLFISFIPEDFSLSPEDEIHSQWLNLPQFLPKALESFTFDSRDYFLKNINYTLWNDELERLINLKHFKLIVSGTAESSETNHQLVDRIFKLDKLGYLDLTLNLDSEEMAEIFFMELCERKPNFLRFNRLVLYGIEPIYYEEDFVVALNRLEFKEVIVDLTIDEPEAVNFITELNNLYEINLCIVINIEAETPGEVFDKLKNFPTVQINQLSIYFKNGYKVGFLKGELEKIAKRPTKIIAVLDYDEQHWYRIKEDLQLLNAEKVELKAEGYNFTTTSLN